MRRGTSVACTEGTKGEGASGVRECDDNRKSEAKGRQEHSSIRDVPSCFVISHIVICFVDLI